MHTSRGLNRGRRARGGGRSRRKIRPRTSCFLHENVSIDGPEAFASNTEIVTQPSALICTVAQKYKSIHSMAIFLHSTTLNSSTLLSHSFTPLQNSFTRRPRFVHSTAKFLHSTPPDSFTPLQNSFTRRPQIPSLHCKIPSLDAPRFLHSTAKFLHSTIPCVTVISVPCRRRKSQLPSDGHSSDPLRALACAMYVLRWEV